VNNQRTTSEQPVNTLEEYKELKESKKKEENFDFSKFKKEQDEKVDRELLNFTTNILNSGEYD
jgi:hypothetical protein